MLLVTQGCVVADPPEYQEPVQTLPLLEVYKAVPSTTDIVVWSTGSPAVNFSIPVRSEDAGEPLAAYTFTDYGTSQERFYNGQNVAASTYDQKSRNIVISWTPGVSPGCHIFTLVVAHRSSFQSADAVHLDPAKAGDDAALVSWWANINPTDNDVNTLKDCPRAGLPTL
ncbi:MAG: hypothetical protein ABW061_06225 [Polyangiaceae bacterium]